MSKFALRPYQQEAVDSGIRFLTENKKQDYHAFQILPTGSGKSLILANIAIGIEGNVLILQPSKEILAQNYKKLVGYGYRAGIYSASAGHKFIEKITFATILSIINKIHLFKEFKYILIDECDLVSAYDESSSYTKLIKAIEGVKVLGVTATPYRLTSGYGGGMLKFLNRTRPKVFNECIYYVQNSTLFDHGYLAKLEYFAFNVVDRSMLSMNKAGTDFAEDSLRSYYKKINMPQLTIHYANRLLAKRKNLLVFCSLIVEAEEVAAGIQDAVVVTGKTPTAIRDRILGQYVAGIIKCVVNVGVLTVGFDHPELECILIARSTMSLRLYYQMIGRAMRPHPDKKSAWICDLGGNIKFFGKIEDMRVVSQRGLMSIWNKTKQLTNVFFVKE